MGEKISYSFTGKYVSTNKLYKIDSGAVINKSVCGCGLTTYALTNSENWIVLVPTKALILNKKAQISEIFSVDGDTPQEEIETYVWHRKKIKIICTYDSFYKIESLIGRCRVLVDEVQTFFKNYSNKVDLEKNRNLYRTTLEICEKHKDYVTFVTATPIPIEYFPQWMQDLKQVTYNFEVTYRKTPILIQVKNPLKCLAENILLPILKNGQVIVGGKTFRKCLVFINSISDVAQLISDYNIPPKICGFYCGDTSKNDAKLSELKIDRITGVWDLKQFNFVTSSGWAGCDFYDKEAITIVVSTTRKEYTMVDINTDLMQAVARLRNDDNPNKDRYIFIYNKTVYTKSEEELLNWLSDMRQNISDCCETLNLPSTNAGTRKKLSEDRDIRTFAYKDGDIYKVDDFQFNTIAYQIKEVRKVFLKGFDFSLGEESLFVKFDTKPSRSSYKELVEKVKTGKELTETEMNSKDYKLIKDYFETYNSYTNNPSFASERLSSKNLPDELISVLKHSFPKNDWIPVKDIKTRLQRIYTSLKIKRTAKATDLREYAECDIKTVWNGSGTPKCLIILKWKS